MLLQPDFPQNPFELITSKKNKQFAKYLKGNGLDTETVNSILKDFYSYKVVMKKLLNTAKNPEWLDTLVWWKTIGKQYDKAIASLDKLMNDPLIPIPTKELIKKDIQMLKDRKNFLTFSIATKPLIKPEPESCHQMIGFQSCALYEYLKLFKGEKSDTSIYDFMSELFQNLYKGTTFDDYFKNVTGEILKKNFIDNAYKTRGKFNEFEKFLKPFLSKPQR